MENISLSQKQEQIVLGGLLGDTYFNLKSKRIRFLHSEKQLEYLLWKKSFFDDDISKLYKRIYEKGYVGYSFEFYFTKNKYYKNFEFIKKHLYSNEGRKKISLKYLNKLTPLGLAVWWMDDGVLSIHKGNRYGKLCTHCFNYEENILIQKYFKNKWDIDVDIKIEKNKYYFIRLNVKALRKLIKIIYKYVCEIPSMIYKIDLDYKNNVQLGDFEEVYHYIKNKKL